MLAFNWQQELGREGHRVVFSGQAFAMHYCGMGILHFQQVGPQGGQVISPSSHHVTGWLAKHGRRDTPGCHFTRGWLAGVMEAVFKRPLNSFKVVELECKLIRHRNCVFEITSDPQ